MIRRLACKRFSFRAGRAAQWKMMPMATNNDRCFGSLFGVPPQASSRQIDCCRAAEGDRRATCLRVVLHSREVRSDGRGAGRANGCRRRDGMPSDGRCSGQEGRRQTGGRGDGRDRRRHATAVCGHRTAVVQCVAGQLAIRPARAPVKLALPGMAWLGTSSVIPLL